MVKLLVWGAVVFLLRYELGKLKIQRVDVAAEERKISLSPCTVSFREKSTPIPADAHLVAAKEVEDSVLATRYPVLIFQSIPEVTEQSTSESSPSRKRRRSVNSKEKLPSDAAAVASSKTGGRLFFCILCETKDRDLCIQLLNVLETPLSTAESLQVFLMDGPFVLLFERNIQRAIVLKLKRPNRGDSERGFIVWREKVDVTNGVEREVPVPVQVESCTYVSEIYSTRPHILIHMKALSSIDSMNHIWSVLPSDDECTAEGVVTKCTYAQTLPCTEVDHETSLNTEQITCCCFISEAADWDFSTPSSEAVMFTSWTHEAPLRLQHTELNVSTLLVTGTSSNSVCVYMNGILLTSVVLPAQPADIWCLRGSVEQRYVFGVRCADVNRSFFILRFSSSVQHAAMELVLSFNHVAHALVGEFSHAMVPSFSVLNQILLLNDVPAFFDAESEDKYLDDTLLVKRSVLVVQKLGVPKSKFSCHRLRLREDKKRKSFRKRFRNDNKPSANGDAAGVKPQPFHYIERTQKASSRSRGLGDVDVEDNGGDGTTFFASHAQLGKLTDSLAKRLYSGLNELERLQLIVNDKRSLVRQLDQLIIRQWQRHQYARTPASEQSIFASFAPITKVDGYYPAKQDLLDMETLVSSPTKMPNPIDDVDRSAAEQLSASSVSELKLELQVTLEKFHVIEYVPSSSLVRTEVVLRAHSSTVLEDSFVTLSPPRSGHTTPGWTCSCSVVPTFVPEKDESKQAEKLSVSKARFLLELQFAPNFTFLRMRSSFEATLWLHWNTSCDDLGSLTTANWGPSASALAITSVKLDTIDIMQSGEGVTCSDDALTVQEAYEQLLVISSGSSLTSWAENQQQNAPSSLQARRGSPGQFLRPIVVRPTFALLTLITRERESVLYELSHMTASLPPDIYMMHNPFQRVHLDALQRILHSMRSEILGIQYQGLSSTGKAAMVGENGVQAKEKQAGTSSRSSTHHTMQRDTDLLVHQLLQTLQKRVNFHTMWFDTVATRATK